MAVADQKERYRRQAALCYEIAATLAGARASAMIRLGDAYATLAVGRDRLLPNLFTPATRDAEPLCRKCGSKMQLVYSLPRSDIVPAMQAFCCDTCGETFIWKGDLRPSGAPTETAANENVGRRVEEHYVAASFKRTPEGFAPGPAVECPDAAVAIQRAALMLREADIVGAVAFSRRVDPVTGAFETAAILGTFGEIPEDFNIA